jgi:hypothetical protein
MIKTRTFHAIGQGAFYSEKHDGFSVVYDCGTSSNKDYLAREILSLNKNEQVILFISHFDKDHISGINELKNHVNITHVIMPLLYEEDKALKIAYYKAKGKKIEILENPEAFWGEKTKIIYVKPADSNEKPNESLNLNDSLKEIASKGPADTRPIPSGTLITNGKSDWVFVPYNYDSKSRHQKVIALLEKNNINPQSLKENPACAVDYLTNNPKKLRDIFNSVGQYTKNRYGSLINENSMFLYSGPIIEPCKYWCKILEKKENVIFYGIHRGCIYTGDGNLNLVDLDDVYSKFIYNVGTVQIPHHGSKHNFKEDCFTDKGYVCPVATGQNCKKFPATMVIKDLVKAKCFPYIVTEKTESFYEGFMGCFAKNWKNPTQVWPEEKKL